MSGAELLVAGKALIWFAVPLAVAIQQLLAARSASRRPTRREDEEP